MLGDGYSTNQKFTNPVFVIIGQKMGQRKEEAAHTEYQSSDAQPDGLVGPLSEVCDEDDDGQGSQIVHARDGPTASAGQVESLLQCGRDHVDESVYCRTLSDAEERYHKYVTGGSVETLK